MSDLLKLDALNALPQPLFGQFCGGDKWHIFDIEAQTGLLKINVAGMTEIRRFSELMSIIDADNHEHDPDDFYEE